VHRTMVCAWNAASADALSRVRVLSVEEVGEGICNLAGTYPIGYIRAMDAVLHALADESRRTVLEILRDHPASAGELAGALPIARPGVSRHLRVLREAGLVDVRRDAQHRIYSLRPEALIEVDEWLAEYRVLWQSRLDALHTEIARGKKART
jgi:DNA-binding transcriptional ArsR family regulator